ncbi:uroporphyrinogen-III C-methyltransferase [Lentibacillus amyloliquefaciens]|uniref:Uroporphyrinogen-III C-methyltransferase n=1 Tax=Lentibacillus amyloliquefaciens TaxID=1472767 RepID=A0A0U4EEQ8_9BACI|nr:uroporphyrinogen-III C-methyltransferase [Lentibacillus amyloliquefaciens]ALX49033.1 uroporphyrin-III methyltransferase [Lentibacillus amyloliquefaciens]
MGKVYLVGAGPGDPELITVKGLKAIQQADCIFYDRLINPSLLANAPDGAELIYCGKSPNQHALTQSEINRLLCQFAGEGKVVVRLKGGDPFIFGRGGEEAEMLRENGIPFEIVPGISAGSAAPAYAGIPLTHRDYSSSVTFVSGVTKDDDYWKTLAQRADTLCIYMGVKNLPDICGKLIDHGRSFNTPIALIHWGTTEKQQTVTGTLWTITDKAGAIENPAMIVIGEVVTLRDKIQWFEEMSMQQQFPLETVIG